jgi:hypothetical protein
LIGAHCSALLGHGHQEWARRPSLVSWQASQPRKYRPAHSTP